MPKSAQYWHWNYAFLLAMAFVGYPLIGASTGVLGFHSREVSIGFRALIFGASIVCIAMQFQQADIRRVGLVGPLLYIVAWILLTLRFLWDATLAAIPMSLPWGDYSLLIFGVTLIPSAALWCTPAEKSFDSAKVLVVIVGGIACVFTVAAYLRVFLSFDKVAALTRLGITALDPISIGHLGLSVAIAAMVNWSVADSANATMLRHLSWIRWMAGIVGLLLVIASISKGPLLAALIVAIAWHFSVRLRSGGALRAVTLTGILVLLILALLAMAIELASELDVGIYSRIFDLGNDPSTSDRVGIMTRALQQFEGSPWLGSAFVELHARFYPHNILVEALMAIGVPGALVIVGLYALGARAAFELLVTRHCWLALLYIQYAIDSLVSGSAFFSPQFWCITAAVVGARHALVARVSPSAPHWQLATA